MGPMPVMQCDTLGNPIEPLFTVQDLVVKTQYSANWELFNARFPISPDAYLPSGLCHVGAYKMKPTVNDFPACPNLAGLPNCRFWKNGNVTVDMNELAEQTLCSVISMLQVRGADNGCFPSLFATLQAMVCSVFDPIMTGAYVAKRSLFVNTIDPFTLNFYEYAFCPSVNTHLAAAQCSSTSLMSLQLPTGQCSSDAMSCSSAAIGDIKVTANQITSTCVHDTNASPYSLCMPRYVSCSERMMCKCFSLPYAAPPPPGFHLPPTSGGDASSGMSPAGPRERKSSLSSGGTVGVLAAVLLMAALVYLAVGFAYNRFVLAKHGLEQIPNYEFWTRMLRCNKAAARPSGRAHFVGFEDSDFDDMAPVAAVDTRPEFGTLSRARGDDVQTDRLA